MNIIKKFKLLNKFIKIAGIVEKQYKTKAEGIKDALFFVKQYIPEAKETIEEIKEILKEK